MSSFVQYAKVNNNEAAQAHHVHIQPLYFVCEFFLSVKYSWYIIGTLNTFTRTPLIMLS